MKSLKLFLLLVFVSALALPIFAQEAVTTNTLTFNGVTFSYPSDVAQNVNIQYLPADPLDAEYPSLSPARWQFSLYKADSESVGQGLFDQAGGVMVFNVADLADYEFATAEFDAFTKLMAEQPDLSTFEVTALDGTNNLPFLPVVPAGQIIRARGEYISTEAYSGIAYVAAYRQDASPFISRDFVYTLQALSADGEHYIVAVFPLTIDVFPAEFPTDFNYDDFLANFDEYMSESMASISQAEAGSFSPSLESLKSVMLSISVE